MIEVSGQRAMAEIQAAMTIAKRFPRDETAAIERIRRACQRTGLAEQAVYQYPRGGTKVEGPSIRLAECMAQNWGNLDFGIIELEQRDGDSDVMAYAWDLETNTRQTKVFTVKHERRTRQGVSKLDDPRDVYEMVANQGARRLRACILGVIPGDVQDKALAECRKTLTGGSKQPLGDRVQAMVGAFSDLGVSQTMIEGRLGYRIASCDEHGLVKLRSIYTSLRDGMSSREDWFDVAKAEAVATHREQAQEIRRAQGVDAPAPEEPEYHPPTLQQDEKCSVDRVKEMQFSMEQIAGLMGIREVKDYRADLGSYPWFLPQDIEDLEAACDKRIEEIRASRGGRKGSDA